MITTVADFLAGLVTQERTKLDAQGIIHGPTIGDMYEGLTADLLGRVVPPSLGLQITSGFVLDGQGGRSGQIDCMLVRGVGDPVPYTDGHQWHVRDVLAVIEVKKTLYGRELEDAIDHLRAVKDLHSTWLRTMSDSDEPVDARFALNAYAQITHNIVDHETVEALDPLDQVLFHGIVSEHFGPLRIVFGYDGFRTEFGFREALFRLLEGRIGTQWGGPRTLPDLVVSGGYSLAKASGAPYSGPLRDGLWDCYFSSPSNPLLLLLEFVWTRLAGLFRIEGLWDDSLVQEVAHPFLSARPARDGDRLGWVWEYNDLTSAQLVANSDPQRWGPAFLSDVARDMVVMLCADTDVRLDDPGLLRLLNEAGRSADDLRAELDASNLVAFDGTTAHLTTQRCGVVILPDGRTAAGEDVSGQLTRWAAEFVGDRRGAEEA